MTKVRVYTDYDPVRVLVGIKNHNEVAPTDELALKSGLSGNFLEIEGSELPTSREFRKEWCVKNGKVEIDQDKVAKRIEKEDGLKQKAIKAKNVFESLGLDKDALMAYLKDLP